MKNKFGTIILFIFLGTIAYISYKAWQIWHSPQYTLLQVGMAISQHDEQKFETYADIHGLSRSFSQAMVKNAKNKLEGKLLGKFGGFVVGNMDNLFANTFEKSLRTAISVKPPAHVSLMSRLGIGRAPMMSETEFLKLILLSKNNDYTMDVKILDKNQARARFIPIKAERLGSIDLYMNKPAKQNHWKIYAMDFSLK